jgi:hypothetical protein
MPPLPSEPCPLHPGLRDAVDTGFSRLTQKVEKLGEKVDALKEELHTHVATEAALAKASWNFRPLVYKLIEWCVVAAFMGFILLLLKHSDVLAQIVGAKP